MSSRVEVAQELRREPAEVEAAKKAARERLAQAPTAAPVPQITTQQGALSPKDARELKSIISWIAKGEGFPKRFKTLEQQLAGYNLAFSLMREQWQLALNHIAIIHGQMCIYGELPGTLAERTGEVEEKHVYVIDKDYKEICTREKNLGSEIFGAVCKIKRKGRGIKEFSYTIDEAKHAGQYPATKSEYGGDGKRTGRQIPNPDSPWEKYLKLMLMRKAMAMAIKFEFPDALVGVPVAEYDLDLAPDLQSEDSLRLPRDVSNSQHKADEINQEYSDGDQAAENPEPEKSPEGA